MPPNRPGLGEGHRSVDRSQADPAAGPDAADVGRVVRLLAVLLALMNASVTFLRTLTEAAPAMATLLMFPRATAPPIENASRIEPSVAIRLMSPPELTVA